ncbi:MAG: hypothetical protein J2P17_00260 [Mycobacterium sp.]|nr:hypothetical protein [Mycobacterium sp.]
MLYDDTTMHTLVEDLNGYHSTISSEQQHAEDTAKKLSVAWVSDSGGDDGGSGAFQNKHHQLMSDMGQLLDTLSKAIAAVQDSHNSAKSTDKTVAGNFHF